MPNSCTLIAETPWVLDAVNEKESRARIALLFDATRAANETASAMAHLVSQRLPDGSWPWFPGGTSCDSVTLSILSGCGRLRKMGVDIDLQMATGSLEWLDGKLIAWHREAKQQLSQQTNKQIKPFTNSSTVALALYARTFFCRQTSSRGSFGSVWLLDRNRQQFVAQSFVANVAGAHRSGSKAF